MEQRQRVRLERHTCPVTISSGNALFFGETKDALLEYKLGF